MKSACPLRFILSLAGVSLLTLSHSHAATYYWDTTTTGTWSTGANWSDNAISGGITGTVPLSTDMAWFNQSSVNGAQIVQLSGNQSIAGITFANTGTTLINSDSATTRTLTIGNAGITVNSGAGAVTLGNSTNVMNLSLGTSQTWTNNSSNTLTVVNGISLANAGAQTLTIAGTGNFTLSGNVTNGSGTLALIKNGAGTQTLSGTGTNYTGNTTVNAGTLVLSQTTGYASATTTVNTGGILELTSSNNAVDNWRVNSILAGSGTINKTGAGWIQTRDNANTFSGTFNILQGTFGASFVTSNWTGVTADFNISAGALLDARGQAITVGSLNGAGTVGTTWNTAATVTVGAGNKSGSFSGVIRGSGGAATNDTTNPSAGVLSLVKTGTGTQTLSGTNTYTGGTTINGGTLNAANVRALGGSGTISLNAASTTLRLSTDTAFGSGGNPVYNVQMTNTGSYSSTIELNRATAGASTGITHNFGSLYISLNGGGAATLNVTAGANASSALDTIAFTSMNAGNNNTVTETLNPTGGIITIGSLTAAGNQLATIALSGTTTGNAITGVIGGTGNQQLIAISKIGTSTWTLSNTGNNYTGGTTFSAGTLVFSNGALGTTGAITASGGTLRWASGNTQDISSRLAMTATTSTFDTNGNDVTFASAIGSSVAAALTKTGAGTLTLQGTNTYTGATTVNLGTLTLDYSTNDTTKLSDTAALVLGGGTLNLAGGTHTELVSATTLTALTGSYVTRTSGSSVLQMNTISPSTGTVNFGAENIATTDNLNSVTTGIIGTWATVGGDWAINSGSTTSGGATVPGTGVADGFIRAYTAYTDITRLSSGTKAIANDPATNVRIIDGTGGTGDNTVTGTIAINSLNQSATGGASTISMASQTLRTDGILMGSGAGALTIGAAGGTAALSGTLTPNTTSGSLIITNNSSNILTINSVIAENGANSKLVKAGTGVLVLTGVNTYLGGTTLQDGTIRVGATVGSMNTNGILGGTFNNGLVIANKSTATFDVNGHTVYIKDLQGGGSLGGNVTLGSGTLQIRNPLNAANPYAGIISGTGNLIVGDTSAWVTTSAHTYTGVTTAFGGAYYANILADGGIASGIGQSSSAASNLILNNGTLSYNGTLATSTNRQFTLSGNGGLGVQNTGSITWTSTAAITHSATAARTFNLTGSNTGIGTLAAGITDSGTGANITGITKTGTGTWLLTNTGSTFTGAITLNTTTTSAGTLSYTSAGGTNAITFNQTTGSAILSYIGATDKTMSGAITANALTTGTITLDSSGTGAINYSNTGSFGTATSNTVRNLILSGTSTGNNILAGQWVDNTGTTNAATLTKNGTGTWILTNSNTYTGGTTVNAGILALAGNNTVSATAGNLTINNATLQLQANVGNISGGISSALGYSTGSATGNANPGLNVGTTGATFELRSNSSVTFNGTSGIGGLSGKTVTIDVRNNGSGTDNTLTFSPNGNVYGGTMTINVTGANGYSLALGNWNSNGTGGSITFNPTTASVSVGSMTANTGTPTRTVVLDGTASGNSIGAITSINYSLTKSNTSTWSMTGTSTYTGATNVNGGRLAVNGSITSAVTVASGAILGGSGTISGTVSISSGGAFAAGNSIESLASGNLTLAAAAIFAYEMDNDAGAGVAGDLADVTGNFNLDLGNASILTLSELGSGSWTAGEKLTLVSYTGLWNSGLFNYGSSTLADDSIISFSGMNWTFNYNDTSAGTNYVGDTTGALGFVTMTAIPEPRAALLGCLSVLLLLRRRR